MWPKKRHLIPDMIYISSLSRGESEEESMEWSNSEAATKITFEAMEEGGSVES